MKVISLNANGIRSAVRKGLLDWLSSYDPDVLCLQETKASESQLDEQTLNFAGYHQYYVSAEKKGYSGVAIWSKVEPDQVITKLGFDVADTEGRYIQCDFGDLSIVSLYLPSGSSGEARQALKYEFMEKYEVILSEQLQDGRDYIICGDWNIVHTQKDIKNWTSNQKSSGCLPEERAWLDKLMYKMGWVDAFRVLNQDAHEYSWWSYRGQARANNVGWRIDYQMVTPALKSAIQEVSIYREEKFSDHAPVCITYNRELASCMK